MERKRGIYQDSKSEKVLAHRESTEEQREEILKKDTEQFLKDIKSGNAKNSTTN